MFTYRMVHVHAIKFNFHIVLGAPPPILAISSNIFPLFLDEPGFNIGYYLSINVVGIHFFSVGAGIGFGYSF